MSTHRLAALKHREVLFERHMEQEQVQPEPDREAMHFFETQRERIHNHHRDKRHGYQQGRTGHFGGCTSGCESATRNGGRRPRLRLIALSVSLLKTAKSPAAHTDHPPPLIRRAFRWLRFRRLLAPEYGQRFVRWPDDAR